VDQRQGNFGAAAASASTRSPLASLLQSGASPNRICQEIAAIFQVRSSEIALLQLENKILRFLFPEEFKAMGVIPLSSPSIAAHTALSGEPELFNNFSRVKHATVFETVKLHKTGSTEQLPIQKMMSSPIFQANHEVVGVLQVSRKGAELAAAGPDFTVDDLRQLQAISGVLSNAAFLQPSAK
jgi:hypothetical protein